MSTPALAAAEAIGLAHRMVRTGPVRSLAEAARLLDPFARESQAGE